MTDIIFVCVVCRVTSFDAIEIFIKMIAFVAGLTNSGVVYIAINIHICLGVQDIL